MGKNGLGWLVMAVAGIGWTEAGIGWDSIAKNVIG